MNYINDFYHRIFLGNIKFYNVVNSTDSNLLNLALDKDGNLVTGTTAPGNISFSNITGTASISQIPTGTTSTTVALGNHTHSTATTSVAGFMSAADKTKLDGISTGATAVSPATVAPLANGTAAVGTSTLYARQDHVHPLQATVAALTTGRTFSLSGGATGTSAAFTGAANATIPVTLATPTNTVRGGVLQQAAIADSAAAPTQAEFNAVLAALRAAGVLAV